VKNVNTLRVQGDDSLIIVKDEAVIHVTSTDMGMLWAALIALALILTYMVHKFKCGLSFVNKVAFELDGIDLKIVRQAESIKPMAESYFDEIEKNTRTINEKVKGDFDQLEVKWAQFLAEMHLIETGRAAQYREVKVLSERLLTHLERIEPVKVDKITLSNPF